MALELIVVPTREETREKLVSQNYGWMTGKKISRIRPMSPLECHEMGWVFDYEDYAVVVEFEDGTAFVPLRDPEGNGCGFLAATEKRDDA